MDPMDFLGAVLRRPRLDPQQHSLAASPSASSATHPHDGGGAGADAAAFPTSAAFVATGGPGTTVEEASRSSDLCVSAYIHSFIAAVIVTREPVWYRRRRRRPPLLLLGGGDGPEASGGPAGP